MPTRTSAFVDGDDFELGSCPAQAEKTFADVLDKLPAIDWDKPDNDAIHDDGVPPPVVLLPHDVAAESATPKGKKGKRGFARLGDDEEGGAESRRNGDLGLPQANSFAFAFRKSTLNSSAGLVPHADVLWR